MADPTLKKYIFKITPNNKSVVLDTSVLLNGYPYVSYPLPNTSSGQVGYILDLSTFKFVDTSTFNKSNIPYPTKIEIIPSFPELPFYGINYQKNSSTDPIYQLWKTLFKDKENNIQYQDEEITVFKGTSAKIRFNILTCYSENKHKLDLDDIKFIPLKSSEDGTYDTGEFRPYDYVFSNKKESEYDSSTYNWNNYYQYQYKFTVNLYWSDNKSHVTEFYDNNLDYWTTKLNNSNVYPLTIKMSFTNIDGISCQHLVCGYAYDSTNHYNEFSYTGATVFPDDIMYYRDSNNNNGSKSFDMKSSIMYFEDLTQNLIDDWTENPTLKSIRTNNLYFAAVSDNFEQQTRNVGTINISATFTSDEGISVTGYQTLDLTLKAYSGCKKAYVKLGFVDKHPLEVFSPTIIPEYTTSINDEANTKVDEGLQTEYYGFKVGGGYNINPKNYTYPGIYVTDAFACDSSNAINGGISDASKGKFIFDKILFDNYCLNSYDLGMTDGDYDAAEIYNKLDNNVFSNTDASQFYDRFIMCGSTNTADTSLIFNYVDQFQVPVRDLEVGLTTDNYEYVDLSLPDVDEEDDSKRQFSIDNDTSKFTFKGAYGALYSYYAVVDGKYYQRAINAPENTSLLYYTDSNTRDIDAYEMLYGSADTSIYDGTLSNFKVVSSDGVSSLYKYCVNSLIDPANVQLPRYAVYPILSGYVTIAIEVYDFTDDCAYLIIDNEKNQKNFKNVVDIIDNNLSLDADKLTPSLYEDGETETQSSKNLLGALIKDNKYVLWTDYMLTYNISDEDDTTESTGIYGASLAKSTLFSAESMLYSAPLASYVVSDPEFSGPNFLTSYPGATLYFRKNNLRMADIRINGILNTSLGNSGVYNYINSGVDPNLFVLSVDEYKLNDSSNYYESDVTITYGNSYDKIKGLLVMTNDENEKHLTHYSNEGKEINTNHSSSMLLRANPKLSGNIKLVVDKDYNLYLDTFKANSILNNKCYRKYPISSEGNYPRDVKSVFKNIPTNKLFGVPENSLKAHKAYHNYADQYETMYEYGAETNTDSLYSENMKILAPLHIGNNIPDYFAIFRYKDVYNSSVVVDDTEKFKTLIKDSDVVTTFDLRTHTSIGQYLNNYLDMITNYGQCYLQFIEQDYDEHSESYRQGNNIWKGISVKRGILVDLSETSYFGSKILNGTSSNKQELFNNYIIAGFERHNLIYPNIINVEFMFNDSEMDEYSMHRYFGLYLSANDFIKYKYIISDNKTSNRVLKKFDMDGNLYTADNIIYNTIFTDAYKDRIFYAITNNHACRINSTVDLNSFFTNYVVNTPESNLLSLDADEHNPEDGDKSFITLHFTKPLQYGEHLKFIAMNYTDGKTSYTNVGNVKKHSKNVIAYNNVVYEIIASNDERLKDTDYNINPYVNTQKCIYSENTYFYRLTFYSQDLDYPEVTATLKEQINRIVECINKFNTFIRVSYYDNTTIGIISTYDEMYLQHIDVHDFEDFKYDYFELSTINSSLYTTNADYTSSIDFLPHTGEIITDTSIYEQSVDSQNDWLIDGHKSDRWVSYVETEDPENVKYDHISYFNENLKYNMYALTNLSDYFDNYYAAFSNYEFETVGWRYNTVVKFQKMSSNYTYELKKNVQDIVNTVKYPLVYNTNKIYDTVNLYNIEYGYLRNNIMDPDIYTAYITKQQQFIFNTVEACIISSPYDTTKCIISTPNNSLLTNNKIHLYNPTQVSVAIMGISNINDINTMLEYTKTIHMETNLQFTASAGETIICDESDYRIQYAVMYEIVSGCVQIGDGDSNKFLYGSDRFLVTKGKIWTLYQMFEVDRITMKTKTVIKLVDKQKYQDYNYSTTKPTLKVNNYHIDPNSYLTSEYAYPVVPAVNCAWKSNGYYYDSNNVLDVRTLNENYKFKGHFVENVYTPSDYATNQYVTNKIDNVLYVDGHCETYKECILNQDIQNPIKKLLIDNTNVETASVYYNSAIKSLEFIFSGIKFNIKLNSKMVNTYIHLEDYTNFEAFVINDFDFNKCNEMYISMKDKMILIINHQFYIDYQHEAVSNIKNVTPGELQGYADYAAFTAPYNIDFSCTVMAGSDILTYKKSYNGLHTSLMSVLDEHNLWSSLFCQYDIPVIETIDSRNEFLTGHVETINEYDNYVTFGYLPYNNGYYDKSSYSIELANSGYSFKCMYGDSHSYLITKSDGYNADQAYNILKTINDMIHQKYTLVYGTNTRLMNSPNSFDRELTLDLKKLINKYKTDDDEFIVTLSLLLNNNALRFVSGLTNDDHIDFTFDKSIFTNLQTYLKKIIATETTKEKLDRYVSSFTDDVNIYVIPETGDVKFINNTVDNNPLMFTLSIPNRIKFNYGWFTPDMNEMFSYYVDDEIRDILDVDLMLANTKIKKVSRLYQYTGNKVFNDSMTSNLDRNYFFVGAKSLLSSTWDTNYYRLYTDEINYTYTDGYKTGIDDKSFFGSKCMVVQNEYIQLDTWKYPTANNLYAVSTLNSQHNVSSTNNQTRLINIRLSYTLYNMFINNKAFVENWNAFDDSQYTGMKNYINNTLLTYYNLDSDVEVVLYAINTNPNDVINMIYEKPADLSSYYVYENYSTKIITFNSQKLLRIIINETTGKDIYPIVKIYKR